MKIDIRQAVKKLAHLTDQLSADKVALGTARAINHTLAKGKTAASKEIRSVYNIKASYVGKAISITKSSRTTLEGTINISGSPMPIMAFSPRQTQKGVAVTIKRGNRKLINRAFIRRMKSGHIGVYARGEYESNSFAFRKKRIKKVGADLPIEELKTTSIPSAFTTQTIITAVATKLEADLGKRLEHEFTQLISKI